MRKQKDVKQCQKLLPRAQITPCHTDMLSFYAKIPNNCVIKPVLFVITEGIKGKSSDVPTLMSSSSLFQPYKMTQI